MRVLSESDEKKFLFPRTYIETPYGKIDFGLPTLATLYLIQKSSFDPVRMLAIWYLTGSIRVLEKYDGKYIWEMDEKEMEKLIEKTHRKFIPVIGFLLTAEKDELEKAMMEMAHAFQMPLPDNMQADEEADVESTIGAFLNRGYKMHEVMSMTLQELYIRLKALKLELKSIEKEIRDE